MSFTPEDAAAMIGDAWMTSDGEVVRAYFLKFSEEGHDLGEKHGSIGTAVSRDLLHWKEGPEALLRGGGTGLIVGYGKASFGGAVFRETDGTV